MVPWPRPRKKYVPIDPYVKGVLDARRLSCNISMNLRTIVPKAWWVLWILFSRPWFCKIRSLMKTNTWRIVASCIKGHLGPINKHSSERLYIPSFPKGQFFWSARKQIRAIKFVIKFPTHSTLSWVGSNWIWPTWLMIFHSKLQIE